MKITGTPSSSKGKHSVEIQKKKKKQKTWHHADWLLLHYLFHEKHVKMCIVNTAMEDFNRSRDVLLTLTAYSNKLRVWKKSDRLSGHKSGSNIGRGIFLLHRQFFAISLFWSPNCLQISFTVLVWRMGKIILISISVVVSIFSYGYFKLSGNPSSWMFFSILINVKKTIKCYNAPSVFVDYISCCYKSENQPKCIVSYWFHSFGWNSAEYYRREFLPKIRWGAPFFCYTCMYLSNPLAGRL